MDKLKRNADIIFILLLGAVLRISISVSHSYSNDELSAINRLRFDNFSDLINQGVMTGDMHPAGVQLFMKGWSTIGGVSEGWMRSPFVLCGILSLVAIFFVGKKWFNRRTGVIAAALLATLYFPVLNSEFARPYSPGLLICLLIGWWMHKVLLCEVKQWKHAIILGFLFAAAMYTHYFAFLMAGFMGLSGLFLLNKENYKYYLLSAILGILLFVPHIGVTQYHLSVGGLGWLSPPDIFWLKDFIFHAFNESVVLLVILSLLLIATFFYKRSIEDYKKVYLLLCIVWFFGVYLVGHALSLIGTPVLKFPVMLFALPFLFLLIAFWLSRFRVYHLALAVVFAAGINSTIFEKDLYGNMHYGLFKEVAEKITDWEEEIGEGNTYIVYNLSNPDYMNYYARQWGKEIDFDWDVIEYGDEVGIEADLKKRQEEYCIVGYSARLTLVNVFETVKHYYPNIIEYKKWNNCAVFLMKRGELVNAIEHKPEVISSFSSRENDDERWQVDDANLSDGAYTFSEANSYGPVFSIKKGELNLNGKYMRIRFSGSGVEGLELTLTVSVFRDGESIKQRNGENFWFGQDYDLKEGRGAPVQFFDGQYSLDVFDEVKDDDEIRIQFWNRNGEKVYIEELQIELLENIWN